MALWYLESNDHFAAIFGWKGPRESEYSQFTDCTRCIVRADTEQEARRLASAIEPTTRKSIWFLDAGVTDCVQITIEGASGVVLADIPTG